MQKKTLVIGASHKSHRYSNLAVRKLRKNEYPVIPLGRRSGEIADTVIYTEKIAFQDVHTVTLYLNAGNQKEFYQYILNLAPQRIIFNPGTENPEFKKMAIDNNIEVVEDCTLMMLDGKRY